MTKEQLENRLYERMSAENEAFLADLRVKPVDEIISHAYEIACRDNLLMLFEDETSPVSYTHLDVYKRQPCGCLACCKQKNKEDRSQILWILKK